MTLKKEDLKISKTMYEVEKRMENKNLWAIRFFMLYVAVGFLGITFFSFISDGGIVTIISLLIALFSIWLYFEQKTLRRLFLR